MAALTLQRYRKIWEDIPELKEWLAPMEGDSGSAFCRVCCRPLHAHKKDLINHAKTKKHHKNLEKFRNIVESYENSFESTSEQFSSPSSPKKRRIKREIVDNADLLSYDPELDATVKNITIAVFPGTKGSHEVETRISEERFQDDFEGTTSITIDASASPDLLYYKLKSAAEFKEWLLLKNDCFFCMCCKKEFKPTRTDILRHASSKFHQHHCKKAGVVPFQADNANVLSLLFGKTTYEKKKKIIDLRSDTVTVPTPEMKEVMLSADIGDDCFGDDPSVKSLENKVAALLEKEAGLLMPTGTMSNLVAVLTHCSNRDSEVILGDECHLNVSSMVGITRLGGVMHHTVKNEPDGTFSLESLRTLIENNLDTSTSITTLVCFENTHNRCGGKALPVQWIQELGEFCRQSNILLHLDGARLLHASIACGISPMHLARPCHSVSFCLNKGLGAPLGSVLVGSTEFIERARKIRTQLGGTMHQAGFFASAASYALEYYSTRLHLDHGNAREIAQAIRDMHSSAVCVDLQSVQTNIVLLHTDNIRLNAKDFCDRLSEIRETECSEVGQFVKILMVPISQTTVRFMTHLNLTKSEIFHAVRKIQLVISEYDNMLKVNFHE